jgi:phage N-6-adenine-methyltransferase
MARDFGAGPEFVKGARKMPKQKPGLSKQDYATPPEFIAAVKKRFGIAHFAWDLAATEENAVDGLGEKSLRCYYGPDQETPWYRNALSLDCSWNLHGDLWLNPPYSHIEPWANKCAESTPWRHPRVGNRRIFFLAPAAVGSNWFARHVDGKALVLLLNGRISFDGKAPYPKDTILACYGLKPGYAVWRWKDADKGI